MFFFFQAEDGIRDKLVTGVQTCALPISGAGDAIHSVWRAALLPAVSASGLRGPETAVRGATGLEYRVRTMTLCVEYSLERYDFPAGAGGRPPQPPSAGDPPPRPPAPVKPA